MKNEVAVAVVVEAAVEAEVEVWVAVGRERLVAWGPHQLAVRPP